MADSIFVVVGGGRQDGILVRDGCSTTSTEAASRLSTGSYVKQLTLSGERLHYRLVSGTGPANGWVSTHLKGKPLVLRVWKVVGGGRQEGIIVRDGSDVNSIEAPDRLCNGAYVKEIALEGDRLKYELLIGQGPEVGWVSVRFRGNDLVVKLDAAALERDGIIVTTSSGVNASKESEPVSTEGPVASLASKRRLRILALHGQASNSTFMKFQTMPLKQLLGQDAEWFYVNAPMEWSTSLSKEDTLVQERSELERRLAGGKPMFQWYKHGWTGKYALITEAFACLGNYLVENAPIDVVLAFSQASNLVTLYQDALRRDGLDVSWKINVFFCGGQVDDPSYGFVDPLALPTIRAFNAAKDDFFPNGEPSLAALYSQLVELPHYDGHSFPGSQPRAGEIFAQVVAAIKQRCGWSG